MARTKVHPISEHVRENLAAANPFYRGPYHGTTSRDERIRPLDPEKTARDLGREEYAEDERPTHPLIGPDGEPSAQMPSGGRGEHTKA